MILSSSIRTFAWPGCVVDGYSTAHAKETAIAQKIGTTNIRFAFIALFSISKF
jgi:hypothetical protein